jgi:hypothetical protein
MPTFARKACSEASGGLSCRHNQRECDRDAWAATVTCRTSEIAQEQRRDEQLRHACSARKGATTQQPSGWAGAAPADKGSHAIALRCVLRADMSPALRARPRLLEPRRSRSIFGPGVPGARARPGLAHSVDGDDPCVAIGLVSPRPTRQRKRSRGRAAGSPHRQRPGVTGRRAESRDRRHRAGGRMTLASH